MLLLNELRSKIQYKIILPFLALTLLVALAGSSLALLVITGSAQERLNNQLAQTARDASDLIVQIEQANLAYLREIAFAAPNPFTDAPAVADALAAADQPALERAIDPFFQVGRERGIRVDRLIVFDRSGRSLIDWERRPGGTPLERDVAPSADLSGLWFVPRILTGSTDPLGDKFAGLIQIDGERHYLYTVAPVVQDDKVVGGVIVAFNLDLLLRELNARLQAAFISVHQAGDGAAFASTAAGGDLAQLQASPELLARVAEMAEAELDQGVFDTLDVNLRSYQFAYAPLRVRGAMIAVFSVALSSDYVIGPWSDFRLPLVALSLTLMAAIIGIGVLVAGQITRSLRNLASTAEAVIGGDLERRSTVESRDEVGTLATSFNAMTSHLLELYGTVRTEASQRAAIFESIADGIVVSDTAGVILLVNPALRELIGIGPDDPIPPTVSDLRLQSLETTPLSFGDRGSPDLFRLRERIIRLTRSAIRSEGQEEMGFVYVLQDMTSEVAVDRAKTNFIATISHELRTPLTVIGGASDLLLSGVGDPPTENQRPLLESIRDYTRTTTSLINNIITIASLDAGTISFVLEPIRLAELLRDLEIGARRTAGARGLELLFDLPADLPPLLADPVQIPLVLRQLLDNACRYTERGTVRLSALAEADLVQIEISDTGPGIQPALQPQLFERFTRGAQGINSTERGIGLGLAIARELVERQGGRIWLAETSAAGTTFRMTFAQANVTTRPAEKLVGADA